MNDSQNNGSFQYTYSAKQQEEIIKILQHDPTPSYKQEGTQYGMKYGGYDIKFDIKNGLLHIVGIDKK